MKKTTIMMLLLLILLSMAAAKQLKDVYIRDFKEIEIVLPVKECSVYGTYLNGTQKCLTYSYKVITEQVKEGIVYIDAVKLSYEGFFCSYHGDFEVHCVSLTDGYHKGEPAFCSKHGGMTCKIIKLYDFDKFKITETNGELPDTSKYKTEVLI